MPGVLACLRIARAARASASRVLRAAGANEYAELLEELYGLTRERDELVHGVIRVNEHDVTPGELSLVLQWRELTGTDQRALTIMIEHAVTARHYNRHAYELRLRKEGA